MLAARQALWVYKLDNCRIAAHVSVGVGLCVFVSAPHPPNPGVLPLSGSLGALVPFGWGGGRTAP